MAVFVFKKHFENLLTEEDDHLKEKDPIQEEIEDNEDLKNHIELDYELSDSSDFTIQLDRCETELNKNFDACDRVYETIGMLENALETGDYKDAIAGLESYYKVTSYCQHALGYEDIYSPGLESLINTPLSLVEPGILNLRNAVISIYNAVSGIIKWLLSKIEVWIKKIIRLVSGLGRKLKKLNSNYNNFKKTHPKVTKLSPRASASLIEFIKKKYPGIHKLAGNHVSLTPGLNNLGRTMVNLLFRECTLVYPNIDTMPLGNQEEFCKGLTGFYRAKSILNCKKAVKDSPEFGKLVAGTQKVITDNDNVICKIYSVDYRYAYYVILSGSDISSFKPDIGKVALEKIETTDKELTSEDGNLIFNNEPIKWLDGALKTMLGNYKQIQRGPEKVHNDIRAVKNELNKAYKKYQTSSSNKDVASTVQMYLKFTRKIVTKYQEGMVKSAIASLKDLVEVSSRLYSEFISSASEGEAQRWDETGRTTANKIKENDLNNGDPTVTKKQRFGNKDDNKRGIEYGGGKRGIISKIFQSDDEYLDSKHYPNKGNT